MSTVKQKVILMAEDDMDDRLLVTDALTECKLDDSIRFVADGEELMDYLLRRGRYLTPESAPHPTFILLDLNMPRKDGRQVLREIRAHPDLRRLPVVVFTTSKAETDLETVYDLGANSFVVKPVAFDALVKIVGQLAQYWFGIVEQPPARIH
jgi:two-component system, response regulator